MPTRSFRTTPALDKQLETLMAKGFGNVTQVVSVAIDRMHRDECPRPARRVELWQHRTSGERYAVLADGSGRAVAAVGPLSHEDAEAVMGGEDDFDWADEELADAINEQEAQAADARGAYRRVWPEPSA